MAGMANKQRKTTIVLPRPCPLLARTHRMPHIERAGSETTELLSFWDMIDCVCFFVIRLYRGRMIKKTDYRDRLPRAAAAAQPNPELSSAALSGLKKLVKL